jgi:hypothetical protein
MEESAPRPLDDRANIGLGSSVGLRKGLLVLVHAKNADDISTWKAFTRTIKALGLCEEKRRLSTAQAEYKHGKGLER